MNKIIEDSLKIFLAMFISLIVLSLFSLIYNFSGIHIVNETGATDYKWEAGQLKSNMFEGFSWLHMDEEGFNNAFTKKSENIDYLLMGSSHMEAVEVSEKQNTGYLLNELLTGYTYNIGTSGHTIYHCVNNIGNAVDMYNPNEYVIIETDRVELLKEDMQQVIDGSYAHIQSYDSGLIYYLQKWVPAIKVIYKQVEDWRNQSKNIENNNTSMYVLDDSYEIMLKEFLNKAVQICNKSEVKLIIFYQPQTAIDENGMYIIDSDDEYLDIFSKVCKEEGIIFVDMSKSFEKLYESDHILAHGFSNTAVGYGHLNKHGHKVIADRLVSVIQN